MSGKIRVLLVEDKDDSHVASALLKANRIGVEESDQSRLGRVRILKLTGPRFAPTEVHVKVLDGIDDVLASIPVECKGSDVECVAAILDADANMQHQWERVKGRLKESGCAAVPDTAPKEGLILQIPDGLRVGVWVMPDNRMPGILEDFALSLVPDNDPVLPLAKEFLESIPSDTRPFASAHFSKVLIHVWLAIKEKPGKPLGLAIQYGYLHADKSECQPFTNWLCSGLASSST